LRVTRLRVTRLRVTRLRVTRLRVTRLRVSIAGHPIAGVDCGSPDCGSPDCGSPDCGSPDCGCRLRVTRLRVSIAGHPIAGVDCGSPDCGWVDFLGVSCRYLKCLSFSPAVYPSPISSQIDTLSDCRLVPPFTRRRFRVKERTLRWPCIRYMSIADGGIYVKFGGYLERCVSFKTTEFDDNRSSRSSAITERQTSSVLKIRKLP
jgi:hypothetical protein